MVCYEKVRTRTKKGTETTYRFSKVLFDFLVGFDSALSGG